ncbi:hypothetical protein P4S72_04085 [Vibrio sp. PP-XX7]
MIFVWSSNPDDVIKNIKNFSDSAQTALAVSRLAELSAQRVRNEVTETEASIKVQQQRHTGATQTSRCGCSPMARLDE